MIEPKTETVELFSRLGKVGSIQAFDPWDSRKSVAHAQAWVARVASLSYGNSEASNPEKLFQRIMDLGHLSCLEFVPDPGCYGTGVPFSLPAGSLRLNQHMLNYPDDTLYWGSSVVQVGQGQHPASAFLVSCPLYTRSQWMRHRSFSYLEMSRRYTKGSKVAWSYYGDEDMPQSTIGNTPVDTWEIGAFWAKCENEYQRRLNAGWPNEVARGCMPMEAMTTFWVAGFDRDWREFIRLRSDAHAQPEIRVYSDWIFKYLDTKERK
jgi:hypothetical protein